MVANSIQDLPAFIDSGQHSIVTAPADTGPSPRMRNLILRGSGSTSFLPAPVVALSCNRLRTLIIGRLTSCRFRKRSWLFELALVLVRFDHVASIIVNANRGIVPSFGIWVPINCTPRRCTCVKSTVRQGTPGWLRARILNVWAMLMVGMEQHFVQ